MNALETYIRSSVALSPDDLTTITALFKPGTMSKGDFFGKRGRQCNKLSFVEVPEC